MQDGLVGSSDGSARGDALEDNFWIYESVAGSHVRTSKPAGLPTPRSPGEAATPRTGAGGEASGDAPIAGHDSDEMLLGAARNRWLEPSSLVRTGPRLGPAFVVGKY